MAALTTYGTSGLLATTIANYIPTLADNIFTSKPLLFWLQSKGRVKPFSGTKIVQPLLYAEAPNVGVYSDADTFSTAANTGISAAEYEFRQFYGLVHFTGIELEKNSGKQALLSLVDARLKQLELTISENLDELLFTGTDSAKSWLGLVTIMSASSTVGDISQSSYSWWRPTLDTDSEALSLATMRRLYNSASSGNDHPDGIFTTMAAFEAYENLIDDNARFLDPKMADAGFQSLMFKGAPITFDTYCTSGAMNFLNSKYITLARMPNVWFKASDWLLPTNADVMYKHIRCYGNLVFSNLKRQAAATALSNT